MSAHNPVTTFLQEAEELLARIEEIALATGDGAAAGDSVHQLFRAFHTIKGSGAMFGFDEVAAFTHHVETLLDRVREGEIAVSRELVALILSSRDHIKALLDRAQGGPEIPAEAGASIVGALQRLLPTAATLTTATVAGASPSTVAPVVVAVAGAVSEKFRIRFRPCPGLMTAGTNPLALLDELRALGECEIVAKTEAIPPLEQIAPDQCFLAWEIKLTTSRGLNAIKDVFIFVEDGSEIRIEPDVAVESPTTPRTDVGTSPAIEPEKTTAPTTAIRSEPASTASKPPAAHESIAATPRRTHAKESTVRVPSERLDRLVNLVGELVMNQSRISQVSAGIDAPDLAVPVEELERLIAELRDNVLGIRMMPIGTTFGRFKRLVHDLSEELGKEIDLVTEGAETELDKTVLDQLGDPLVHLIRNSIDHGIEQPEERERQAKPRRGTLRLAAVHTGSNVVITIDDDGKGVDAAAIRAKAIEKKLITPEAKLSEKEMFDLILLPGFSTAKTVTSVSGRGVGMDAVKKQIDALRGTIQITSTPGRGTTISLTLPLTLAIIDGLLVSIDDDRFIIPTSAVTENVELSRSERCRHNGRNVIAVRGELVPYIRLREAFTIPGDGPELEKVVLVRHGGDRVGLVVDRVLGSHQTVIQALGRFYRDIEVLSGATIMGDGRVALILDVAGMVRFADRCSETPEVVK